MTQDTSTPVLPPKASVADRGEIPSLAFADADGETGQNQKVLLMHSFWRRHLGARDNVVGEKIRLNSQVFDIVGVLPKDFSFLQDDVDVFTPAAFGPADKGSVRARSYAGRARHRQ